MPTFTLIATATPASGALTASFTNIPSTFTDLYIKSINRELTTASNDSWDFRINGSTTTANYRQWRVQNQVISGNTGTTYNGANSFFVADYTNAANDAANDFAQTELYISRYADNRQKPMWMDQTSWGYPNSRAYFFQYYNLFDSTDAITSIEFRTGGTAGFATGTVFYLYGIKNS